MGMLCPLLFYMCLCYLSNDDVLTFYNRMTEAIHQLQLPAISGFYIGFLIITALLFIFALFHYFGKGFGGKIKAQKTKYVILWLLGLCLLMAFFEQLPDMILLSCGVPLSILLGDYIAEIKQLKTANTLLVVFMVTFVVVYFYALEII